MAYINTLKLQNLWNDVHDNPEWATTRFWEYVFKKNAFGGDNWNIASQQPPTRGEGDLRRVDLVVEGQENNVTLLLIEAKRADAGPGLVEEVEYQAFTACCAHLYDTGRSAIWAMTFVGSGAKFWVYHRGHDFLTPFWPDKGSFAAKHEYIEYAKDGNQIIDKLNFIKKHPTPTKTDFKVPPTPRPTHAKLSPGWHDREVAIIAPSVSLEGQVAGLSNRLAQQSWDDAPGAQFQSDTLGQSYIESSSNRLDNLNKPLDHSWNVASSSWSQSNTPDEVNTASGSSTLGNLNKPVGHSWNDTSGSRLQSGTSDQGLVVDTTGAIEVFVETEEENNFHKCLRTSDNMHILVPRDGWTPCRLIVGRESYHGYTWTSPTNKQYFTWSLEPMGKLKGKPQESSKGRRSGKKRT